MSSSDGMSKMKIMKPKYKFNRAFCDLNMELNMKLACLEVMSFGILVCKLQARPFYVNVF